MFIFNDALTLTIGNACLLSRVDGDSEEDIIEVLTRAAVSKKLTKTWRLTHYQEYLHMFVLDTELG